ncbi:hypothetical protein IE077_000743, partial [Cardiosporidium cionae]
MKTIFSMTVTPICLSLRHSMLTAAQNGFENDEFWSLTLKRATKLASRMHTKECKRVLKALSIRGVTDETLLKALAVRIALMNVLVSEDVHCITCFKKQNLETHKLMHTFLIVFDISLLVYLTISQDVITVFTLCLSESPSVTDTITASDIADICLLFSEQRFVYTPLYASMAIAFCLKISSALPEDILHMAASFAKLELLDPPLMEHISQSTHHIFGAFNVHQITTILMTLALFNIPNDALFQKAASLFYEKGKKLSAEEWAINAFSFARFSHCEASSFLQALSFYLPPHVHTLTHLQKAELCISCQHLGLQNSTLVAILPETIDFSQLDWPLLASSVHALATMGMTRQDVWQHLTQLLILRLNFFHSLEQLEAFCQYFHLAYPFEILSSTDGSLLSLASLSPRGQLASEIDVCTSPTLPPSPSEWPSLTAPLTLMAAYG